MSKSIRLEKGRLNGNPIIPIVAKAFVLIGLILKNLNINRIYFSISADCAMFQCYLKHFLSLFEIPKRHNSFKIPIFLPCFSLIYIDFY